ncbi:Rap guanine nucleotide exchange factor 4 [Coelomomyces lativittatus]|nr:Rap guanine nucleotide exchange factor 4 [Coelomomyces lativittatus]
MPPKLNTHFLTQDHSTVTKYSDVLKKERNIHSAPPGSLLKGTVHNVNSKNSRPSSHKTRTNSFNATSELFSTSPVPASEPAVDIDKLVKLVENTFPPWSSEYLPELPREENDLPSLNQHRLRQSEESKKYKQWTDEKKRHVVFLKNITHCVKLPTTMPQKSLRSNPKYLHVQSKLLQKKTTSVVPETTSSLNYTNLNFWMSNPSEKEKKKKSSMSMSKPSSSITKSTSLSHAILPSDAGQSLLKLNLDLNVSIHRIETRTEEFMAPEGLPLKSIQRVMDLYKQYRPEITEFETFNLRLLISILKKLPHQRTKIEIAKALPEVMKIKDFQKFSSFFASELLSVMYLEELNEGTCIFKQGDEGTAWYAILFGAVQIFVSTTGDLSVFC